MHEDADGRQSLHPSHSRNVLEPLAHIPTRSRTILWPVNTPDLASPEPFSANCATAGSPPITSYHLSPSVPLLTHALDAVSALLIPRCGGEKMAHILVPLLSLLLYIPLSRSASLALPLVLCLSQPLLVSLSRSLSASTSLCLCLSLSLSLSFSLSHSVSASPRPRL